MKRRATDIQEKVSKVLLLAVLAGTIASCDSILNYEEDCAVEYRVKFKYDYNMEERDKFPELVRTVTLYAFDANNNLVYQKTDEGEMLADGSYVMDVDSIDPTQHHLVVWAGLNDESFAVPLLQPTRDQIERLTVRTVRQQMAATRSGSEDERGQYIVEKSLHSLWHGEVITGSTTRVAEQQTTEVSLVKNTNTFRIVVAQVNRSGGPTTRLSQETFDCAIYDNNGHMNYDNSLLEDNLLTYRPYNVTTEAITSRAFSDPGEPTQEFEGIVSELSIARLVESQNPELIIQNSTTQEVLFHSANLIEYLETVDAEKYQDRNYTLQEYLDREDQYEVIIFVDEKLALINSVIQVNGWIIHINQIEL